ncbi:MAG: EVE domain-containing protein [Spongiibacteraceae bacterium]
MNYWLFKSEPDEYSIDDLAAEKQGVGVWNGIRNFQARNLLRDNVQLGDQLFFYHSSCKQLGIAGAASVVKTAYADPSQFDPKSKYFDAKATIDTPRWFCVDIQFKQRFYPLISLQQLKAIPELADMTLLRQGRLSIQPVTAKEWVLITALGH